MKTTLVIVRGVSCSGKDTKINSFLNERNIEKHVVVSSDVLRQVITNDVACQDYNAMVFDIMHRIVEARLKAACPLTIVNATNLRMKDVSPIINLGKLNFANLIVLSIDPPSLEELKKRSSERAKSGGLFVPEDVLTRQYERYFNCITAFEQSSSIDKFVRLKQEDKLHEYI